MRVFLLVQDDPFFLPRYLPALLKHVEAVGASVLGQKLPTDSITGVVKRYARLMGFRGLFTLAIMGFYRKAIQGFSLRRLLRKNNVPLIRAGDINAESFVASVRKLNPDLIVSIACPQKIRKELLSSAPRGGINLHGGYLPDFPGVFTPFWNLLEGADQAGCTVHWITERIDGGPILGRKTISIEPGDTIFRLYEKIAREGIDLLVAILKRLSIGDLEPIPNEAKTMRYHSFPSRQDMREFRTKGLKFR